MGVELNLPAWRLREIRYRFKGGVDSKGNPTLVVRPRDITNLEKLNGNGHSKENALDGPVVYQAQNIEEPSPVG